MSDLTFLLLSHLSDLVTALASNGQSTLDSDKMLMGELLRASFMIASILTSMVVRKA